MSTTQQYLTHRAAKLTQRTKVQELRLLTRPRAPLWVLVMHTMRKLELTMLVAMLRRLPSPSPNRSPSRNQTPRKTRSRPRCRTR